MGKCVKPTIAGAIWVAQTKSMPAVLIQMKLNGYACLEPRINNTKLTSEQKVIAGNNIEHRWGIFWHFDWAHTTVYWTNKSQFHRFRV